VFVSEVNIDGTLGSRLTVEHCFTSHQLIYGHVDTDDDNDDDIYVNRDLHFKDRGSFTSPTTYTWNEMDMPLISQYVHRLSGRWVAFCRNNAFGGVRTRVVGVRIQRSTD